MEILYRPSDLRCAIWHNLKNFLDQSLSRTNNMMHTDQICPHTDQVGECFLAEAIK